LLQLVAGRSCLSLVAAACSEQRVGDRAVLAAARSVRPQHAAVGGCAQRAAPVPIPESPVPLMQQRI